MAGLVYMAYPNGCWHKSFIPAEAKALPHEGASAFVICCAVHSAACATKHCHVQTLCHNETICRVALLHQNAAQSSAINTM